jgi:hypothetical protein
MAAINHNRSSSSKSNALTNACAGRYVERGLDTGICSLVGHEILESAAIELSLVDDAAARA